MLRTGLEASYKCVVSKNGFAIDPVRVSPLDGRDGPGATVAGGRRPLVLA